MHQVDHVELQARIISASRFREALDSCRALLNKQIALLPLPADWEVAAPNLPSLMGATRTTLPGGTLIACTSGSTGTPKGAQLGPEQLEASYNATHSFLHESFSGRPGPWLLALPAHHIAGIQVILRSLRSGFDPHLASHLAHSAPFTPAGFINDVAALRCHYPAEHLYTSLVPAQLERIATDRGAVAALTEFTCVLAGGAAVRPALAEHLRAAGVTIVESYGSSETAGGVVYDGRAIPGARVTIESADERGVGTVVVAGPMVARGYLNVPGSPAFSSGSYRTSDIGVFGGDATLRILGRADGAVNSGGYKVLPEEIEDAIHSHVPGVVAAVAVGANDPELGQAIHAAIEFREAGTQVPLADEPVEITREVREALRGAVARHLVPRRAWRVRQIPLIGPGKVDRRGVAELVGRLGQ